MERKITFGCAVAVVLIAGFVAYRFVANPMAANREVLNVRLAEIRPVEVTFSKPNRDFDKWQDTIAAKPVLWQELVAPPPPPKPPPERPPDVNALLKGVKITRMKVGDKIKIITPSEPKGSFMGAGDTVNGVIVKEITKTSVVFSLPWHGQELTAELPRK